LQQQGAEILSHLEGQYPAQLTRGISRSIKLPPVLIQRGCYNSPTGYSGTATKFGQQPLRCKPVDVAIPDLTIISKHSGGVAYRDESRPVYVLVAGSSWSAGEGVPFILQERRRATIVGEKTAGAANPGGPWPINSYLSITIPLGHIKTAVKGTNWEGTGVIPDIAVSPDKAFVVAYVDALQRLIDSTTDPVKRQALNRDLTAANKQATSLNDKQ
jgi:hypothetical protein